MFQPFPAAIVSLLCAQWALGSSPKIASDLDNIASDLNVRVIVQFDSAPRVPDPGVQAGGVRQDSLDLIGAAVYSMPARALAALAQNPHVLYVSPDREVRAALDYATAATGAQAAFQNGLDGTGIGIAVIDSGIQDSKDLLDRSTHALNLSRIVYSQNFVPGSTSTDDAYGHGTHIAGILAGDGSSSSGGFYFKTFRGIAPNAKLINLRALDSNGAGTDSSVINAINAAIQLRNKYNIRVINLSLGRPVFESYRLDPLCQAVENAWKAGIVVVTAAGNQGRNQAFGANGYATIMSPGNDPLVITVGAMKTMSTSSTLDDQIASYSSKGPTLIDHIVKPDIVAPGNRIISLRAARSQLSLSSGVNEVPYTYYQSTYNKNDSSAYYRLSGTSMAAPMVSGAAALMLMQTPYLSPDEVKGRLMKTASKSFPLYSVAIDPVTGLTYTSQYDIFTIGAGYLNVWAALNCNSTFPRGMSTASPVAVLDTGSGTVSIVNADTGSAPVWGSAAGWDLVSVWGNSVIDNSPAAVPGISAVWGAMAVSGNTTLWGAATVWGSGMNDPNASLGLLINGEN